MTIRVCKMYDHKIAKGEEKYFCLSNYSCQMKSTQMNFYVVEQTHTYFCCIVCVLLLVILTQWILFICLF